MDPRIKDVMLVAIVRIINENGGLGFIETLQITTIF